MPTTSLDCPDCDFVGKSPQSIALHRLRAHEKRGGIQRATSLPADMRTNQSNDPPKRRGRPPKVRPEVETVLFDEPPKRRPGRPRKVPLEAALTEANAAAPIKRGPGRPRKATANRENVTSSNGHWSEVVTVGGARFRLTLEPV